MRGKVLVAWCAVALGQFALAADDIVPDPASQPRAATGKARLQADSRERGAKAVAEATRSAIESVKADTKLDLDIRLIGPTSVTIAAKGK